MKTNYVEYTMYRFLENKEKTMLQIIKKLFNSFKNNSIKYDYFKTNYAENIPKLANITTNISDSSNEIRMNLLYRRS